MKTIVNRTPAALAIHLPQGKVLRLSPGKAGQISDKEAAAKRIVELVADGTIEVVEEGAPLPGGGTAAGKRPHAGESHRPGVLHTKGDR
jgi:hypothetical protein